VDQLGEEIETKHLTGVDRTLDQMLVQCIRSVVELQRGLGLADQTLGHFVTRHAGAAFGQC
jgi:hypothetical protein